MHLAPQPSGCGIGSVFDGLENMVGTPVIDRVHGIQAQAVHVVLLNPQAHVVQHKRPHGVTTPIIVIDRLSPRRVILLRE